MNELVISIKNAYKKFGEQVVLNDVSLEIYKERIYGIIGRNGSGKTVLFKSICGFILLDSGEITVLDKVIGKDVDMPKNVGLIIETPGFLKDYSAYWNLKFLADLNKKITNDDIKNAIRRVGLNPEDKKAVTEMRSLLLQMKDEGKTIIMASHSSEDIDILCDEVYEMEAGKIVRE